MYGFMVAGSVRGRARRTSVIAALTVGTILSLAACGSSPTSSTATTVGPTGTSTSKTTPTTMNAASTSTSTTAPPVVTSVSCPSTGSTTVCEFYSPTRNISCEIDPTEELCLTVSPPQAAHLHSDGTYTTCMGENCLSNAGLNTGILAYGTSTSNGTFTCVSRPSGMTCTASGKGFTISTSGIRTAPA